MNESVPRCIQQLPPQTPPEVLEEMAQTYRDRNSIYGDNWRRVGAVMRELHPDGMVLKTQADHELFHLWSLLIVKLTRFANTGFTHKDSIHDAAVYAAMIEAILQERAA